LVQGVVKGGQAEEYERKGIFLLLQNRRDNAFIALLSLVDSSTTQGERNVSFCIATFKGGRNDADTRIKTLI